MEGNPGRRPIPTPPRPQSRAPKCPTWLDVEAKAEWHRVAPDLERMHLLSGIDRASLAVYCSAVAEFEQASAVLRKNGRTFETPNGFLQARPEVAMMHRAAMLIRMFAEQFGLTPSARTRLGKVIDEDEDDSWVEGILTT
jgi:P27 family predicted phage terminase small subunit